ncbi:MAG: molecular chaperone TorD family protein [Actinomycetia bacterium]|nr:molecular chaperone TorD family protein [Actinomycetes bacterium]
MTEWSDEARTRQGLYRFIGVALRPPESERHELLAAAVEFLDDRDLDRYPYAMAWRRFRDEFRSVDTLEPLEIEYVRLFGVGMGGTPATPTESFYRVPARDGGIADFVSKLQIEYRSMGLASNGTAESPDHISTELEVMSYLCGVEADAWETDQSREATGALRDQARFLGSHLVIWVPTFAGRARSADAFGFYGRLIDLLHAYVIHEGDFVRSIVKRSIPA